MSTYTIEIKPDESEYGDGRNILIIKRNGKQVTEVMDRGEPEDNSFSRDWLWVLPALLQAYKYGVEDGRGGK